MFVQWEYTDFYVSQKPGHNMSEQLTALGRDGWELVNVDMNHGHYWCILKRPKPAE